MLKLKLQYFGHLMQRPDSFWKDPDAGKDWGQEEEGSTEDKVFGWHHWLSLNRLPEIVNDREAWHAAVHGGHKELDVTEQQEGL